MLLCLSRPAVGPSLFSGALPAARSGPAFLGLVVSARPRSFVCRWRDRGVAAIYFGEFQF